MGTSATVPVYDVDGITIYHADCADVLPTVDPADVALVLTDPPYGMAYEPSRRGGPTRPNGSVRWGKERIVGDAAPFDPEPLLRFDRLVIFGANHFAHLLPPARGWIVWDKCPRVQRQGFTASDCELAWSNASSLVRKFPLQWGAGSRGGEPHLHPTQKPVALMRWVLDRWTEPDDLVLDPYMGSGPVAQACHEMGRRYVGVEIVEDYCRVAVERLRQQTLDLNLPA